MPPKKAGAKKPRGRAGGAAESTAPVGDSGANSEVCSPTAAGASSTFVSPSQESAASPISEKGAQRQPARRTLQACLEGSSSGLLSAHSPTWAHLSSGRGAVRTKIPIIPDKAESVGGQPAPPDTRKAPAAAARKGLLAAVSQLASALPATTTADDQQTQDADGQAAAPQLRFEVRTEYVAWQRPFRVRCMQPCVVCVFAFSLHMTELVRHWCVCWHVQCRLYGDDGVVMPTGAEGVSIPPEINTHSTVGHVLVLCKISRNTADVHAA